MVFVNNGSTDNTGDVFQTVVATMGFPHQYIHESTPGINNARNAGVTVARHDTLVFTDDDCHVSRTLLTDYRDEYERTSVGFIGGQVRPYAASSVRLSIQEREQGTEVPAYGFLRAGLIHGANMSIRRQALTQCGMFDPRFGVGGVFLSASDVETLARILFEGWHGLYSPKPWVLHDRGRMAGLEIQRVRRDYDVGRGAYYMKMMLDPRARPAYLKNWGGRILLRLSSGRVTMVVREFQGALRFLWNHLTHVGANRPSR